MCIFCIFLSWFVRWSDARPLICFQQPLQPALKVRDENACASKKDDTKPFEFKARPEPSKPSVVQQEQLVPTKEPERAVENENDDIPEPQQLPVPIVDDADVTLDMSMDSIIGSPMSVDHSVAQRRINYQQAEEEFYNVTEYQTEIYKYMKTAEVRKLNSAPWIKFT